MALNLSLQASDLAIVFATLLGPVLAIQIQRRLDRSRALSDRRVQIFRTLMATRASILSPEHVNALNAVPVEFFGTSQTLKEINNAWKSYLDHLNVRDITGDVWFSRRSDLMNDMLSRMSKFLGYEFSKSQLERDIYSPTAYGNIEADQTLIRTGLVKIFKGEAALPLAIKEFPFQQEE